MLWLLQIACKLAQLPILRLLVCHDQVIHNGYGFFTNIFCKRTIMIIATIWTTFSTKSIYGTQTPLKFNTRIIFFRVFFSFFWFLFISILWMYLYDEWTWSLRNRNEIFNSTTQWNEWFELRLLFGPKIQNETVNIGWFGKIPGDDEFRNEICSKIRDGNWFGGNVGFEVRVKWQIGDVTQWN